MTIKATVTKLTLADKETIERYRSEIIEECARVVLRHDGPYEIVQAIRELKDKP